MLESMTKPELDYTLLINFDSHYWGDDVPWLEDNCLKCGANREGSAWFIYCPTNPQPMLEGFEWLK